MAAEENSQGTMPTVQGIFLLYTNVLFNASAYPDT